jgi:hypothetical protein
MSRIASSRLAGIGNARQLAKGHWLRLQQLEYWRALCAEMVGGLPPHDPRRNVALQAQSEVLCCLAVTRCELDRQCRHLFHLRRAEAAGLYSLPDQRRKTNAFLLGLVLMLAVVEAGHISWLGAIGLICLLHALCLAWRIIRTRWQIRRLRQRFAEEESQRMKCRAQELGFCNTRLLFTGRYAWLLGCRYHGWFVPDDARIDRHHEFWPSHKTAATPYLAVVCRLVGSALSPMRDLAWWDGGSEDFPSSLRALRQLCRLRRKAALQVVADIMRRQGAPEDMTAEEAARGMRWLADCCPGAFVNCSVELSGSGRPDVHVERQALDDALWEAAAQS